MSLRSQWIRLVPTEDQISRALREGHARFALQQVNKAYKPFGNETADNHIRGRLAEIVFSEEYLGLPAPEDIDLATAQKRGHDVGGWQVRSNRWHKAPMMIKPSDKQGTYVHLLTHDMPKAVYATGWLTKAEAVEKLELGPMKVNPRCIAWEVPQEMLHPLPNIEGRMCITMQLAA